MPAARSSQPRSKSKPIPTTRRSTKNKGVADEEHQETSLPEAIPTLPGANIEVSEEPKKKGRGRPPKTTSAVQPANNDSTTGPPPNAVPHKRSRKGTNDDRLEDDNPQAKRARVDPALTDVAVTKTKKPRAKKATQDASAREPLPERAARNTKPANKAVPRRTSKEVAAAREAQQKALEEKIREGERAREMVARMNLARERQDDQMVIDNPVRLSAAIRKWRRDDNSDEGEGFDFDDVDNLPSSDIEVEPMKNAKRKKAIKPVKGATRKEIEDLTETLRGEDGGSREQKKQGSVLGFTSFDTAPKKYQNAGLRKNIPSKKVLDPIDPLQSGGLNDGDMDDVRPTSYDRNKTLGFPTAVLPPKDLKRDLSRKNNLIAVIESGSDVGEKSKPKKAKAKKVGGSKPPKIPTEVTEPPADDSDVLRQFLEDPRWTRIFLPTITHALYISRNPFVDWTSDSETYLATVQQVFNLTFPNVTITLSLGDGVVNTVYQRIKSRKLKLASGILDDVKAFFNKDQFGNQPLKIRDYVRWALKPDGPAYYQSPTPQSNKVNRGHKDYIAPEGFLQSEFITQTAEKFLGYAKSSVLTPNLNAKAPPRGLYVLILTAVERAFTAHLQGTFVQPPKFGHENYWQPIQDFSNHIDRLSENRWACVLDFKGGNGVEDDDEVEGGDRTMISAYRADFYIPSSPQKA